MSKIVLNNKTTMEHFRENLEELISENKLSLRQLEKESGVSAMQYSRYLRNSIPTIEVTMKIAKYFNCSIDFLFGLDNAPNRNKYKTYDYDITQFVPRYLSILKENKISHYKFSMTQPFNESILRHWQAGRVPRLDIVYLIANYFGSSMDYLIGRY